jgi:hypothetical protein
MDEAAPVAASGAAGSCGDAGTGPASTGVTGTRSVDVGEGLVATVAMGTGGVAVGEEMVSSRAAEPGGGEAVAGLVFCRTSLTGGVDEIERRRAEPSPATRTPNVPTLPPPEFRNALFRCGADQRCRLGTARLIARIDSLAVGALPGAATPRCPVGVPAGTLQRQSETHRTSPFMHGLSGTRQNRHRNDSPRRPVRCATTTQVPPESGRGDRSSGVWWGSALQLGWGWYHCPD